MPATLATSSMRRSSALSRSICSLDHLLETVRDPGLDGGQLPLYCPVALILNEHLLRNQSSTAVTMNKRVAVRASDEFRASCCKRFGERYSCPVGKPKARRV